MVREGDMAMEADSRRCNITSFKYGERCHEPRLLARKGKEMDYPLNHPEKNTVLP